MRNGHCHRPDWSENCFRNDEARRKPGCAFGTRMGWWVGFPIAESAQQTREIAMPRRPPFNVPIETRVVFDGRSCYRFAQ